MLSTEANSVALHIPIEERCLADAALAAIARDDIQSYSKNYTVNGGCTVTVVTSKGLKIELNRDRRSCTSGEISEGAELVSISGSLARSLEISIEESLGRIFNDLNNSWHELAAPVRST